MLHIQPTPSGINPCDTKPARMSFFDFPSEVRNAIYHEILFHGDTRWRVVCGNKDFTLSSFRHAPNVKVKSLLSNLNILSTINRQLWEEARSYFWRHVKVHVYGEDNYTPIYQFLTRLRRGVGGKNRDLRDLSINVGAQYPRLQSPEYNNFRHALHALRTTPLPSLQRLTLSLDIRLIYYDDHGALEEYFVHGQPLQSRSLKKLARVLRSIPRLRSVTMDFGNVGKLARPPSEYANNAFQLFAYTGMRERKLHIELDEYFNANSPRQTESIKKFGDITVFTVRNALPLSDEDDRSLDFEWWKQNRYRPV